MAQRIQADAPLLVGSHVAEMTRHIAVRRFMQGDGKQHRDRGEGNGLDQLVGIHSSIPNGAVSPLPRRISAGASPVRSMTVVGSSPTVPLSIIRSTRCSRYSRISVKSVSG